MNHFDTFFYLLSRIFIAKHIWIYFFLFRRKDILSFSILIRNGILWCNTLSICNLYSKIYIWERPWLKKIIFFVHFIHIKSQNSQLMKGRKIKKKVYWVIAHKYHSFLYFPKNWKLFMTSICLSVHLYMF